MPGNGVLGERRRRGGDAVVPVARRAGRRLQRGAHAARAGRAGLGARRAAAAARAAPLPGATYQKRFGEMYHQAAPVDCLPSMA